MCGVLGSGLNGGVGFLLPDLGTPVTHGQEQVSLFAVLGDGQDGAVVCLPVLAEDDVRVEFSALHGLCAALHLGFLEREQDALFGADHHAVGTVGRDFKAGCVEQFGCVHVGCSRLTCTFLHQDVVLQQFEVNLFG